MAKVNITLDDDLLRRIDDFACENYMKRSSLISLAVTQYLNSSEAVKAVKDLAFSMRKIADSGQIDEDTRRQLEDFERFAKMLVAG